MGQAHRGVYASGRVANFFGLSWIAAESIVLLGLEARQKTAQKMSIEGVCDCSVLQIHSAHENAFLSLLGN